MHNSKKRCFATVMVVLLFSQLIPSTVDACTTFCLFNGKDLIFGRNYDFPIGYGHVVINKRGVFKSAMADAGEQAAQWTSKYGSMTFNQFGRDNPMGGMNEAGLIVELMQLDETQYPSECRYFWQYRFAFFQLHHRSQSPTGDGFVSKLTFYQTHTGQRAGGNCQASGEQLVPPSHRKLGKG